jgi:DNA modification methylase
MGAYQDFLATKHRSAEPYGHTCQPEDVHPSLFGFQRHITVWAVRQGRAAVWATTGLGKTRMQLEWARLSADRALIVAPLAVCEQTVREAAALGIPAHYVRDDTAAVGPGVWVTNYEMAERFDAAKLGAVVLDEASILKQSDGKTRTRLIRHFAATPRRLACTATPAPNDPEELTNQAEFLGVMSRREMLAAYFVHDSDGWRLKGHARAPMFRWMATWAVALRSPADLGYPDDGYLLPPLTIVPEIVTVDHLDTGDALFPSLGGVGGRAAMRRKTLDERCERAAQRVLAEPGEQWLLWCGLNAEAERLESLIPGAVNVHGTWTPEDKARAFLDFADGKMQVLITKPSIAAFGLNWQNCARQAFVGINDSYESYFQAIRRSWRFGQTREVRVHVVVSDLESEIVANVRRKEGEAAKMTGELIEHMQAAGQTSAATVSDTGYAQGEESGDNWRLMLGDSCERLAEIPDKSIGLSVYSPPFASLFTYSPTARDLGNSADRAEFFAHYDWIIRENLRVTIPGRIAAVHVQQVATTKATHGMQKLTDFRGEVIRAYEAAGWWYVREITVDKDPQAQAIRTKAHNLMFATKNKDSSRSWPALADYLLIFQKPGDNPTPVATDVTNEEWILWARPVWYDIHETATLNVAEARDNADERHICPLQLPLIERAVRLWSNKGETVLSPFAGIGSEGYVSLQLGRRFVGCELKPSYWRTAVRNLRAAEQAVDLPSLWDAFDGED